MELEKNEKERAAEDASRLSSEEQCRRALLRMKAVTKGERDLIANLANTSAVIKQFLEELSWVGFYLLKNGELVLGPFQGKSACKRIVLGKGVCGTAALLDQMQLVADVNQCPGHIACDKETRSEIVLPIHARGVVCAVLDLDSRQYDRFHKLEAEALSQMVAILEADCDWDPLF